MKVLKDDVAEMIRGLPADASLDDIQYHLYVLAPGVPDFLEALK